MIKFPGDRLEWGTSRKYNLLEVIGLLMVVLLVASACGEEASPTIRPAVTLTTVHRAPKPLPVITATTVHPTATTLPPAMTDEVECRPRRPQRLDFRQRLLHAVLAEQPLPRLERCLDPLQWHRLAHRD